MPSQAKLQNVEEGIFPGIFIKRNDFYEFHTMQLQMDESESFRQEQRTSISEQTSSTLR